MPDSNDLKSLDSQLKKTLISAESFKKGSSVDVSKSILNIQKTFGSLIGSVRQLVASVVSLEKIVNNNSRKITSLKNISKTQSTRISGENIGAKLPGSSASNVEDSITKISVSVASIAAILAGRKKALDDTAAFDRRKAEQEKRGVAEGNLEKKFEGLKSSAEKVIAPVKSILDRIIDFFVTVFLGRVVYKLLEWFGDKKNADKVRAIGRFLGDHWPKLLALYLLFGTALGGFARGLVGIVAKGAVGLLAKILLLNKARNAQRAGRFLSGRGGRNVVGAVATTGLVAGTLALSEGLKGSDEPEPAVQKYSGGGFVMPKFPAFRGGGFNFKGMLGGMGDMFGGMGNISGEDSEERADFGFVSGEKGVDKIPAMLSDGEFVMSAGAVKKYGVDTLEGMNAAGGGTNKPKMMGGTTYAQGGGFIGQTLRGLGKFLPGTGTVMAPYSRGPRDISNSRQAAAGYQNKLLGFNLGGAHFPKGATGEYSKKEQRRYYEQTGRKTYFAPTNYGTGHGGYQPQQHGLFSSQTQKTRQPSSPITLQNNQNNQNLNLAIQNARDVTNMPGGAAYKPLVESAAKSSTKIQNYYDTLRTTMRDAGMKGADESMNMHGKPIKPLPVPYEKGGYAPKSARPTSPIGSSKPVSRPTIKPLTPPKPRVMYVPAPAPQSGEGYGGGASTSVPSFSASGPGGSAKQKTLGVTR
jgi:hypothetical protein